MNKKKKSSQIWGGRFDSATSALMKQINQSINFDKKLYSQDIAGSIAHATMLGKVGIIKTNEAKRIVSGLNKIKKEIEEEKFNFSEELEDIHMNIEARLSQLIGDVAGKLHTARSRNDQVATDFKLYIREQTDEIDLLLKNLQKTLLNKAEKNIEVIMPGFTHLQCAQPISFAHHLMAYFEMFKRDRARLMDCRKRLNECPLGCGALAGTVFPIDRFATAKLLGFDRPNANSLDGVADRDFALEFLSNLSILSIHLSRFAEEIVLWMSKAFDFISLSDAFTSGSSMMPQKKNPDAAELVRAKSGRIFAALFNLLTVVKALPLTYSKDLQEDKEPVFDATTNIKISILAIDAMVADFKIKKDNMRKMAAAGFSTATDLADWLVINLGIPFRECHHISGLIVKIAEKKNCNLADLSLSEMQKIEPKINENIYKILSVENSVSSRNSFGGTAFSEIRKAISSAIATSNTNSKDKKL